MWINTKRKKIEQRVTLLNSVTVMRHGQFGVRGGKTAREGTNMQQGKTAQEGKHAQEPRAAASTGSLSSAGWSSQLGVSEAVSRPSVSREVTAANIT